MASVSLTTAARAESLNEALAAAYEYNPQLDAERARLRATDEEVTRARSGFRPVITGGADINYNWTKSHTATGSLENELKPRGYSIDAVQPIFSGFRTINSVNEQEANVRAARETLRAVEQSVLLQTVTSFMDVVRDQAIVRLRENNVNVLSRELQGDRGPLRRRRGDAHGRGAGAGAAGRSGVGTRPRQGQSQDQPRRLRARRRACAGQPRRAEGIRAPSAAVAR